VKLIFLDVDGVLNDHSKFSNGYCGIQGQPVRELNRILAEIPDARIVLTSAWRYLVTNGSMTLAGLEALLLSHGVDCYRRVLAITYTDEHMARVLGRPVQPAISAEEWFAWIKEHGIMTRERQIARFLDTVPREEMGGYVVLDDLALDVPHFVQTDGLVGLTAADADCAIAILKGADRG
jgi:hypothetical protein